MEKKSNNLNKASIVAAAMATRTIKKCKQHKGKNRSAMLIVFTQGIKHTQSHRQLISFAGLAPTQYSSGSSIQGKPRIYKRGGKNLRDVLYMCSMNAMKLYGLQSTL
jgi:transposase